MNVDTKIEEIEQVERLIGMTDWTETLFNKDDLVISAKHSSSDLFCRISFGAESIISNSKVIKILLDVQPLSRFC